MANPSSLETLVDLASREADSAAERLGAVLRAGEEAEQKLGMLQQYRLDYAERCQANLTAGLSAASYSNYRVFMQKLDQAIAGQQELVRECHKRIEEARAAWSASEQKKMSFGTLASRARSQALQKEARREQKLSDEHASRQAFSKRKLSGAQ